MFFLFLYSAFSTTYRLTNKFNELYAYNSVHLLVNLYVLMVSSHINPSFQTFTTKSRHILTNFSQYPRKCFFKPKISSKVMIMIELNKLKILTYSMEQSPS